MDFSGGLRFRRVPRWDDGHTAGQLPGMRAPWRWEIRGAETICRRCQKRKLGELMRRLESHNGIVVLMDCEFGYKSKFWLVPMTGDEFECWWAAQESFGAPCSSSPG